MATLLSRNPRTGAILGEISKTDLSSLALVFDRAKRSQQLWSKLTIKERSRKLKFLRDLLISKVDSIAKVIHEENGKPVFEALACELLPAIELLTFFTEIAPKKLKKKEIWMRNPFMRYRQSTVSYEPLGTVAVIAPWNYPFFLAFGDIVVAVLTGNAVLFKPSEFTPFVGQEIQKLFDEAGFPVDLVQTLQGEGDLGIAMIDQKPSKIFFTGSVQTGKAIMRQASEQLIPVTLELGGKDAMIVLPDADLDFASSAALWGGFTNSGQVCASIERLIVHESVAEEFKKQLLQKIETLSNKTDLGVCTIDKQKLVYEAHLLDARNQGANFDCGGALSEDRTRMLPTLVSGREIEKMKIYREETFGPVMAMTTVKTVQEAIQKVNDSPYGLLASVITSHVSLGEEIAKELQVGTVLINEVVFTAGMPETPWGGMKDSGFGRKHSEMGLYEFVNVKHVNKPRIAALNFKSWWWYPYGEYQQAFFRSWIDLYRSSWIEKIMGIPHFLWCLLKFLKNEPRL